MQYINFFIQIIIYITLIFILITLNVILFKKLFKIFEDISNYKIKNLLSTVICNYGYMGFFIIFLYCLHIYNKAHLIDLKKAYLLFVKTINTLTILQLHFAIFIVFFVLTGMLSIILSGILFHKFFRNQRYILYLFARYHPEYLSSKNFFDYNIVKNPCDNDLISYFLFEISFKVTLTFLKPIKIQWSFYYQNLPRYHFYKVIANILQNYYYKKFIIPMSPLCVILYDCIYHDFILIHLYYFMLFYVPLMLWRQLTILVITENFAIAQLLWNMLYKKENCIYALSKDHYKLFQIYLKNGLKTIDMNNNSSEQDAGVAFYILKASKFTYNEYQKCYINIEGLEIYDLKVNAENNQIKVIEWVDFEETYHDWVIILNKDIKNDNKTELNDKFYG